MEQGWRDITAGKSFFFYTANLAIFSNPMSPPSPSEVIPECRGVAQKQMDEWKKTGKDEWLE